MRVYCCGTTNHFAIMNASHSLSYYGHSPAFGPFAQRPEHEAPSSSARPAADAPIPRPLQPPGWTAGVYTLASSPNPASFHTPASRPAAGAHHQAVATHFMSYLEQHWDARDMPADHKYALAQLFSKMPDAAIRACPNLDALADALIQRLNKKLKTHYPDTTELLRRLAAEQPPPREGVRWGWVVAGAAATLAVAVMASRMPSSGVPNRLVPHCNPDTPTPPYGNRLCVLDEMRTLQGVHRPTNMDLSVLPGLVIGGSRTRLQPNTVYVYVVPVGGPPLALPKQTALDEWVGHPHLAQDRMVHATGEFSTDARGTIVAINNAGGHHQTGGRLYLDPITCTYRERPPVPDSVEEARHALSAHGFAVSPAVQFDHVRIVPGSRDYIDTINLCKREVALRKNFRIVL